MTADTSSSRRTYGNWTKPQSPGLPRLGTIGTVAALGSLVLILLVQAVAGLIPAVVLLVICAFFIAPLAYRNAAGRHGWQIVGAQLAWQAGRRRRQHIYVAGKLGTVAFGANRLPGILAPSKLLEAVDGHNRRVALVHIPAARHYTVLLRADPSGGELVDQETVDTWVAHYGQFLADLAYEPNLVAATVTVETAPDPGHRLAAEVDRLVKPNAPALAAVVLRETAATYPASSATTAAHIALTFSAVRRDVEEKERFGKHRQAAKPKRQPRIRPAEEMATLIGSRLPGLIRELAATGAGNVVPMSAGEVAEMVRVAYDPGSSTVIEAARSVGDDPGITWSNAGPTAHFASWSAYKHDDAASITWQMVQPPRGVVESRVLEDVLAPRDELTRKRVTITYRPHDPASAADIVDKDLRTAIGKPGKRARAAEEAGIEAARQATQEEASGAGVERFSVLVTATVSDEDQLAAAADLVDQLGRASRLRLRRCYGSQDAAFTAALGVGVILPSHILVPEVVREYL